MGPRAWQEGYKHPGHWTEQFAPLSMPELFARSLANHADRTLVDFMGRRFTYAEIGAEARRFTRALQQLGLGKGDRIGLYLPNVPVYLAAYFGALAAGATIVNFSPLYTCDELAAQVADSGARMLVTLDVPQLLPSALEVQRRTGLEWLVVTRLARMLPFWQGLAVRLPGTGRLTPIRRDPGVFVWDELLGPGDPSPVAIDPLIDLAMLQYTGGTTGVPKGAMLSHQNLTANARQIEAVDPHAHERDVMIGVLPLFHIFANACVLNRTVFNGGMIAMLPRFQADQVLDLIHRVRPTTLPGVPTMFQAMMASPRIGRTDFSSITTCISGGAPLPQPVRERFREITGVHVIEGYGLTECAGVAVCSPFDGSGPDGSIGQPLPDTDLRLLDKEDPSRDAAPGEAGELAVRGPQVMQGYWNRAEAAAQVFEDRPEGRWLRTGDVAVIGEDGFVRIVDRIKDMIAVGGFKVFPSQLEEALLEHPAVREAAVLGVPDAYHGEMPRAYAVLAPGSAVTGTELAIWLNARLGKHERVESVVLRESLPRTMVGKLDRKALRAECLGSQAPTT